MKKAISLLTSMMVMSLVAANMAIPATAAGDVQFDIDDVTVSLDELTTDADGNYVVDVPVLCTDNSANGVASFVLKLDIAGTDVGYVADGDSMTLTGGSYKDKDLDSTVSKQRILYLNNNPGSRAIQGGPETAFSIQLTIPKDAKAGDVYPVNWDSSFAIDVSDGEEESVNDIVDIVNGSITIAGGEVSDTTTTTATVEKEGTLYVDDLEYDVSDVIVDGKTTQEITVPVPVKMANNPGLASGVWEHVLGNTTSAVTPSLSSDLVSFGDDALFTTKEVDVNGTRVLYLNASATEVSDSDATLYYVDLVIPAGASVGDTFDIGFNEDVYDFSRADETSYVPNYQTGTVTLVAKDEPTTTTTEPVVNKGTLTVSDLEQDVHDILGADGKTTEAITVAVPVYLADNPGLASGVWEHKFGEISSAVTPSFADPVGSTGEDTLFTDKEVDYAGSRVLYLNANATAVTGDDTLYYVNVVIPAGASVGDTFNVDFDESVADFTDGAEEAFVPAFQGGVITLVDNTPSDTTTTTEPPVTTTTPEPTTTTPEPTTTTPEPTTTTPEPTTTTPEPTTTTPAPTTTTTPEPTTTTPEPTTTTPAPITTTPAPVTQPTVTQPTVTGTGAGGGDIIVSVSNGATGEGGQGGQGGSAEGGQGGNGQGGSAEGGQGGNGQGGNGQGGSAEGGQGGNGQGGNAENNNTNTAEGGQGGNGQGGNATGGSISIGDININIPSGNVTGTAAPTVTTASASATSATTASSTTKASDTTKASTTAASTTKAASSNSPSTGSAGIGGAIMAMIAAAASAFALKKKNK